MSVRRQAALDAANAGRGLGGRAALLLVLLFVLAKLGMHLWAVLVTPYEFHRDELLYFAMAKHLSLWRMDFPPFIALAAWFERAAFGESLLAMRSLPALAGAALVAVAMDTARRLGGRVTALVLAGSCVLWTGLYMRPAALFQPVVFDQLWWSLGLWCLLRRALDDDRRWWLGVGVAFGLGLLTKFSIVFIGLPVLAAVVMTPMRRDLLTRWPWLAFLLTIAFGHPSLTGQWLLGFPVMAQMADLRESQLDHVTATSFLRFHAEQGPATLVAFVGAAWLLAQSRPVLRAVALAPIGAFLLLMALKGKPYYAGPIYPVLWGAGAFAIAERFASRRPRLRQGVAWALVALLTVAGAVVVLPFGLPVLPPVAMATHAQRWGVTERTNQGVPMDIPQDYADMLGWKELADTVARVVHDLPPEQRAELVIVGANYGRTGALDWYGPARGLPDPVSPIGSYWFWGPGKRPGNTVVLLGGDSSDHARMFGELRRGARTVDPRRVPEERDVTVWVARRPVRTLQQVWPELEGEN